MKLEVINNWLTAVRKQVAESPPTNETARLEEAVGLVEDLLRERKALEAKVFELSFKLVTGSASSAMPKLGNALGVPPEPREAAPNPRVWWESADEWPLNGVTQIRDSDGDYWNVEDAADPAGTWVMIGQDPDEPSGSGHTKGKFANVVKIHGAVVDTSPGTLHNGWWIGDGHDSDFYPQARHVRSFDNERTWTRINGHRWRSEDWDDAYVKEAGYSDFSEVLENESTVFAVPRGPRYDRLVWNKGEPEPHESFTTIYDKDDFYWKRTEDGTKWFCPGDEGLKHAQALLDGDNKCYWDELLAKAGPLKERT